MYWFSSISSALVSYKSFELNKSEIGELQPAISLLVSSVSFKPSVRVLFSLLSAHPNGMDYKETRLRASLGCF